MELPPKYDQALKNLPNNDWMLLSELNEMILKYSVGGWKKKEFLESILELIKRKLYKNSLEKQSEILREISLLLLKNR